MLLPESLCKSLRRYALESSLEERYDGGYDSIEFWYNSQLFRKLLVWIYKNIPDVACLKCQRAWFFVYDAKCKGVPIHADDGKITVSIWLTPNDSILNFEKNGLILYNISAPRRWSFYDSNGNIHKIKSYLRDANASRVTIPYEYRRVIVFESRRFHCTNGVHTRAGPEHRRINCTLIFG